MFSLRTLRGGTGIATANNHNSSLTVYLNSDTFSILLGGEKKEIPSPAAQLLANLQLNLTLKVLILRKTSKMRLNLVDKQY